MSHITISQRLHDQLRQIIQAALPGERLPSEPHLAEKLGVSRATLREAMRTFETQGVIRRRQGSGTYITRPPLVIETGLEVLESIEKLAARIGLEVRMGVLRVERRMATDEERRRLSLNDHAEVVSINRTILAQDRAVAYLVDVLPVDIISTEELEGGFTGSVLDLLLERGDPRLEISRTEINVATASPALARALGIQRGDVLLNFIADLYSADGRAIDHSHSYFLPGYFRFHVIRRVG